MILTKGCLLQVKKKEQNYNKLPLHTTNYHCNFPRKWKGKRGKRARRTKTRTDAETVSWQKWLLEPLLSYYNAEWENRQVLMSSSDQNQTRLMSKSGSVSSLDLLACHGRFNGQLYDNTWHNASDCNNFFVDVKLSTKKKEKKRKEKVHIYNNKKYIHIHHQELKKPVIHSNPRWSSW